MSAFAQTADPIPLISDQQADVLQLRRLESHAAGEWQHLRMLQWQAAAGEVSREQVAKQQHRYDVAAWLAADWQQQLQTS